MNNPQSLKVVLATANPGKVREFQRELRAHFQLLSQADLNINSPEETGLSFVENALLKARHAAAESGMPALADDSGLCVDFLRGAPGIYSARYCGTEGDDPANNARLLQELSEASGKDRSAHFVCVLAYMRHAQDPEPIICQANWHGSILQSPRGEGGFGYDPLFLPQGLNRSSAELEPDEKNRLSHRGQAIQLLLSELNHLAVP